MHMLRFAIFFLVPVLGATVAGGADAQVLQPHRAVYDLALAEANDDSDVEGLSGRWVFEFSGSACQGYTLTSRIVMRFDMTEGSRMVDQRVTNFESGDGETFRFDTRSYIDEVLESEVKGTAQQAASGTLVQYEKPEAVERSFGPTLFPTAQLRELQENAEAGEHFYQSSIFDGTEFTDHAVMVSVVVGKPKPVREGDPERAVLGVLADDDFRPVTVAYFDGEGADGEETSDYNVSFKLHDNGIQRDMMIRYEDYSMTGKLIDLSLFGTEEECEAD